jgi:hypothetical protein
VILPTQYGCDTPGCQAVRTETNHWHAITRDSDGIHIRTWEEAFTKGCLEASNTTHHCGQDHALKQVSSLLGDRL